MHTYDPNDTSTFYRPKLWTEVTYTKNNKRVTTKVCIYDSMDQLRRADSLNDRIRESTRVFNKFYEALRK